MKLEICPARVFVVVLDIYGRNVFPTSIYLHLIQEYSDKQRQAKKISRIFKRKTTFAQSAQRITHKRASSISERIYFGKAMGHKSRLFLHTGVAHRNCTNHCRCNSLMLDTTKLVNSCDNLTNTSSLCYEIRLRNVGTSMEGIRYT
jgi:hypothetical protein